MKYVIKLVKLKERHKTVTLNTDNSDEITDCSHKSEQCVAYKIYKHLILKNSHSLQISSLIKRILHSITFWDIEANITNSFIICLKAIRTGCNRKGLNKVQCTLSMLQSYNFAYIIGF